MFGATLHLIRQHSLPFFPSKIPTVHFQSSLKCEHDLSRAGWQDHDGLDRAHLGSPIGESVLAYRKDASAEGFRRNQYASTVIVIAAEISRHKFLESRRTTISAIESRGHWVQEHANMGALFNLPKK
jgi:hypothetical protein